jgi:hypothetical protein
MYLFRAEEMDFIMYRMGILAGLRSLVKKGRPV